MDVARPPHRNRRFFFRPTCRASLAAQAPAPVIVSLDERRLNAALVETMATASPHRREVLALAALGGLAPSAIAALLGLSVETVSVQLHEGVNEVAQRFAG